MTTKLTLLQETTPDWEYPVPNHTYIFGDSTMRIIGYIREGETVAVKFNAPIFFDKRRRKFKNISAKKYQKNLDLSAFAA